MSGGGQDVVIVGAQESSRLGTVPDMTAMSLACESAVLALADAGLSAADADGVAAVLPPTDVAFMLGVRPRWLDGTNVGGCSYLLQVRHAAAALRTGQANVVVVAHGESGRSRLGPPYVMDPTSPGTQFEMPYGVVGTYSRFTLPVVAYLHKHGLKPEDLAEVPVAQSRWANRNPRAFRPELLTVEDVLASPLIAWPFHRLHCCPVNDGGAALVLTTRERAADMDLKHRPVTVLGSGESGEGPGAIFMEDLTTFRAFREASREAMRTAQITHETVDHLMIYDAFAHLPLYGLEDMGFVKPGEAVDFIRSGATIPGGKLPLNTNGGGLLYAHTGMYGMFALQEGVRQLRGTAPAQVHGARTSLVLGVGGMFSAAGAVVLGAD
ncbi:thiolase C-terminal domain-containing protein [Amycolatopsis pithecellobii]|uniref:Thiolase n=1 Tax=Amycolatopsis pithecellobii TaxID=664692 RepID=A0A6N7Z0D8_9PSEU|nr:thiolase [Amycolatopsis pithecellobii]MTD54743.1 thiolase [Amycolatopsis pithecellobii]